MSDAGFDSRPARSSATLAGTVAVAVALAVGLALVGPGPVLVGVGGALSLAGGGWALRGPTNARRAVGSTAVLAGTVLMALTAALAATPLGALLAAVLALAVVFVTLDAATDGAAPVPDDDRDTIGTALVTSGSAMLAGLTLAVLLNLNAQFAVVGRLAHGLFAFATAGPFVGFVTLQIGVVLVMVLLARVVTILDAWLPNPGGDADRPLDTVGAVGVSLDGVPRSVWGLVALQALFALFPAGRRLFAAFLQSIPVVGRVIAVAVGGPLHALLGVIVVVLCGVVVTDSAQDWAVDWLGDDPAESLALQTGGIAVVVAALLGTALLNVAGTSLFPTTSDIAAVVGPAGILIGGTLVAALVVGTTLRVPPTLARYGIVPRSTAGFAVGSALLALASLAGAEAGLGTPLVVVGVAGALWVWDTGAHAVSLGTQLGRDADGTDGEFVHVTATGLVLSGGVLLALVSRYVVVPAIAPPASAEAAWPSALALGLVLVGIILLAAALAVRDDGAATPE